jgi:hypothetical protein
VSFRSESEIDPVSAVRLSAEENGHFPFGFVYQDIVTAGTGLKVRNYKFPGLSGVNVL